MKLCKTLKRWLGYGNTRSTPKRLRTPVNDSTSEYELLNLIEQHTGQELQVEQLSNRLALVHSKYMHLHEVASHDGFSYRGEQLNAKWTGEVTSYGFGTVQGLFKAYLNSPKHRKIIEHKATHIGISTYRGYNTIILTDYESKRT